MNKERKIKSRKRKRNKLLAVIEMTGGISLLISICLIFSVVSKNSNKEHGESKEYVEGVTEINTNEKKEENTNEEERASLEIETKYCTLFFPKEWEEQIETNIVEQDGYKVEFYGLVEGKESQHVFDICFNSDDGDLLGYLKQNGEAINLSVDIFDINFDNSWKTDEMDQIYAIQEEYNFVIKMLDDNENYVNP